jgi:RHS repeat-associated protein
LFLLENVGAGGKLYRFNGIEHSEKLGLDLAEFRTYDPAIGRWLQVDPMAEYAPGWTPYRFGFNNPISYTDALGLFESKDEAKEHAKANGIKTGLFRRNKINKNTDADGNKTYSIDNRKERSSTMSFDDGDGGRVVVVGAMALEKGESNAGALAATALIVTQADSPLPGPADAVAIGMLATAGVMAIQDAIPLPTPDFTIPSLDNIFTQDNSKNEAHGDGGRAESKAETQIKALQEQMKSAAKAAKKKLQNKINNIRKSAAKSKKGENHSRNAKN